MTPRSRGFTHIELLSALSVLSVLAAVAWPRLADLGSGARRVTLQTLSATLTQASIINGAQGQLRAAAQPLRSCLDAGRLLINAEIVEGRLRWQQRELVLADAAPGDQTNGLRECVFADAVDPSAGEVRSLVRMCADRWCRES